MKSILLNESILKWIKKWPFRAVGSCCCLVGPGPEFLIDIPDHIRWEIMEMKQDSRCFHAVTYRRAKLCRNPCRLFCTDEQWWLATIKQQVEVTCAWTGCKCLKCEVSSRLPHEICTVNCSSIVGTHLAILFAVPEWNKIFGFVNHHHLGFMSRRLILWCMMCGVLRSAWCCGIFLPFYFLQFQAYECYIRS